MHCRTGCSTAAASAPSASPPSTSAAPTSGPSQVGPKSALVASTSKPTCEPTPLPRGGHQLGEHGDDLHQVEQPRAEAVPRFLPALRRRAGAQALGKEQAGPLVRQAGAPARRHRPPQGLLATEPSSRPLSAGRSFVTGTIVTGMSCRSVI